MSDSLYERRPSDPLEVVKRRGAFDSEALVFARERTSVGMWRTVRVTGATMIAVSTETASFRVTTSTGRRLSSASAHQISP